MKYFMILCLVLVFSTSYAYDGKVTDPQGRVVNYLNIKKNGDIQIIDKQGRKQYTIQADGKVKNPQGRTLYKIKMK